MSIGLLSNLITSICFLASNLFFEVELLSDFSISSFDAPFLIVVTIVTGIVFIKDNVGLIMGVVMPTIWCNKTFVLHEFAWWVRPEHRTGTIGYKLVKAYIDFGNKLKEQGRIIFFTLSKLPDTPNLDYTKLGFAKLDENWIQ